MPSLALSPVSDAIYAALNVPAVTALATAGVHSDAPQPAAFPFLLFEVFEEETRGFGMGGLPLVTLRVHAFSQFEGSTEAQAILAAAILLLKDQKLTVAGYTHCGLAFYDRTSPVFDSEINGQKCKEIVSEFRIYVEAP
jgi:hypothetical protein